MSEDDLISEERLKKEKRKRIRLQARIKEIKHRADIMTIIAVVLGIAFLTSMFFLLSEKIDRDTEDTAGRLSKDNALALMMKSPILNVRIGTDRLTISSMYDMFPLLRSSTWAPTSEKPTGEEKVTFVLEDGYELTIYSSKFIRITDNGATKTYKADSAVASDIVAFIYDNTTLTTEDLSSLISQTKEVFYNSDYYCDYLPAGSGLSAALDPVAWTELDFYPLSEEPSTITAIDNMTINLYEKAGVSTVIFNGNSVFYKLSESIISNIRNYIVKILSSSVTEVKEMLRVPPELQLETVTGNTYNVIPDDYFISSLSIDNWIRQLESPALPATPNYDLTDETTFSIRFYKDKLTAEVLNNSGKQDYYTIPQDIFTRLELYVITASTPDDPLPPIDTPVEETDTILSDLISILSEGTEAERKILVAEKDHNTSITLSKDFYGLLSIGNWKNVTLPDSFYDTTSDAIILSVPNNEGTVLTTISIYPDFTIAIVSLSDGSKRSYRIDSAVPSSVKTYIEANAVQEQMILSSDELMTLISAQASVKAAVYDGISATYSAGDAAIAAGISGWLKSLSYKAIETKIPSFGEKKSVLTFEGLQRVVLTFSSAEDGTCLLSADSNNQLDGAQVCGWYTIPSMDYASLSGFISSYMTQMKDIFASDFAQSLVNGDFSQIQTFLRINDSDTDAYNNFFSAKISDAEATPEENGKYRLSIKVEEPNQSIMAKGTNDYIVTLSYDKQDEVLYINSMTDNKTASLSSLTSSEEVQTVLRFISRCTAEPFDSPEAIDKTSLINYCMLLSRKYGDNTQTVFSQAEINEIAKRHFGLDTLSDINSALFDKDTCCYTLSASPAATQSVVLTGYRNEGNLYSITIAHTNDPLGLFYNGKMIYTLQKINSSEKPEDGNSDEGPAYYVYISALAGN